MKNNLIFTKAFEYMVHGYSVLPINSESKLPLLSSWKEFQDRAASEEEITLWWKKNPEANVAIVTGKISNITVVDIDMKADGQVTSLSTFPKTYTVQTPSGGYHLYYEYDPEILQTANTYFQFPHTDIRNDGGYVLAPPSKNSKGEYKIIHDVPVAKFPRNLFIKTTPISKQKVAGLLRGMNKMAEGDGRNNALTSVIGKLLNVVQFMDHEAVAYPIALSINQQFKTPLAEKEVRTIFNSIHNKESKKPLAQIEFLKNDKGIIPNEENVLRTIKNDEVLKDKFRYNTFTGLFESRFENDIWETIQRVDIIGVRMYLMRTYPHFTRIPHSTTEDAIIRFVKENKVSPPVEFIKSIVWDRIPRLNSWISKTYNTEDDIYHQAVGSNWLKGMVKRLVHPGSKFDYVLVLEGKQGIKKSTSLSVLGGDWHVETVFTPDNKDFFMLFGGKSIVEFSEGETLSRTEAKHLKAVITMQYDKYRPPYERAPKDFPRQCVFAMTTNQDQYLKDETGNRRWLPVACIGQVNIEWLKENRDQLFAEAYHRVIILKETTYEFPVEETEMQQAMRQTVDPRTEQIYDWYYTKVNDTQKEEGITTRMAFVGGIHGGATFGKEMGRLEEMITGAILRDFLKLERRRAREEGIRIYRYYPSPESIKLAPQKTLVAHDPVKEIYDKW